MDSIGNRIRQRRIELNMSQTELARKLGYQSRSSINKIELDTRNLTQSRIEAIADALDTTPSYIMGWTDAPSSGCTPLLPLSDREKALVASYRSLPSAGKDFIDDTIDLAKIKYKSEAGSFEFPPKSEALR